MAHGFPAPFIKTAFGLFNKNTKGVIMFPELSPAQIERNYTEACQTYRELGIDPEEVLAHMQNIPISLHCWQGDDVKGFEKQENVSGGGIMAIGNYPGPATTADMLREDAERAFRLIPGKKRFNLHAIYAETGDEAVPRDQIKPEHFQNWMDWAKKLGIALDFNPTYFAHPLANDGFTLSNGNDEIRKFWVRHGIACRKIAGAMARSQGSPCIVNHWIPDGHKDQPIDRMGPRKRLIQSLDEIFSEDNADGKLCKDAVECKLFGLGSEDYVVGSHEFYMSYAMTHPQMLCFDMGHFHPTETIHDKISAVMLFKKEQLIHVSRGVRWDSDHVVNFNEDLRMLFQQLVRCGVIDKTHIALDFFDASINRIGAWVIGTRATQKALLAALLEPTKILQSFENANDNAMKLALLEELKTFPLESVWDMFCLRNQVASGASWIDTLIDIDRKIIKKR